MRHKGKERERVRERERQITLSCSLGGRVCVGTEGSRCRESGGWGGRGARALQAGQGCFQKKEATEGHRRVEWPASGPSPVYWACCECACVRVYRIEKPLLSVFSLSEG